MQGQIRIIGGEWRGRKIAVPEELDLRPTPNRVRETLFNWLAPVIHGACCLDPFAGSGALGFEALSRGAAHVVMIDESPKVVHHLKEQLAVFKANNAEIIRASVPSGLKTPIKPFDIVFLDPPFQKNLLKSVCEYLENNHFLANNAYIYLESATPIEEKDLPSGWTMLKSKRAGQVYYHLAKNRGQ